MKNSNQTTYRFKEFANRFWMLAESGGKGDTKRIDLALRMETVEHVELGFSGQESCEK